MPASSYICSPARRSRFPPKCLLCLELKVIQHHDRRPLRIYSGLVTVKSGELPRRHSAAARRFGPAPGLLIVALRVQVQNNTWRICRGRQSCCSVLQNGSFFVYSRPTQNVSSKRVTVEMIEKRENERRVKRRPGVIARPTVDKDC